jgi:hypothetical protein
MDVRSAASGIPHTTAIDGLNRVQNTAQAGDSDDNQAAAGYFAGGKKGKQPGSSEEDSEESTELVVEDVVEISADALVDHHPDTPRVGAYGTSNKTLPGAADVERHVDIQV